MRKANADSAGAAVSFFEWDALRGAPPAGFDVITCSLFLHHLSEADAGRVLASLAAASGELLLVNDLRRGLGGLLLAHVVTRLVTTSRIVHTDGPISVRAAFTVDEARDLARRAGLDGAVVTRRWPCRWLLRWSSCQG